MTELTDEEFVAEVARRKAAATTTKAEVDKNKPDQYYAVKTGDTFASIAKELKHEGEGQTLLDCAHSGGVSNGELAANHSNLIRGANGEAKDSFNRPIPVVTKEHIDLDTKLTEGQSLLLPPGW